MTRMYRRRGLQLDCSSTFSLRKCECANVQTLSSSEGTKILSQQPTLPLLTNIIVKFLTPNYPFHQVCAKALNCLAAERSSCDHLVDQPDALSLFGNADFYSMKGIYYRRPLFRYWMLLTFYPNSSAAFLYYSHTYCKTFYRTPQNNHRISTPVVAIPPSILPEFAERFQ